VGQAASELDPNKSAAHRFGYELRKRREARGLSQRKLGEQVHVSGDLVAMVEQAKRKPQADFAKRCDDVLNAGGELLRYWEAVERERRVTVNTPTHADNIFVGMDGRSGDLNPAVSMATSIDVGGNLIVPSHIADSVFTHGSNREALAMAADRARKFALSMPGMNDLTLEQLSETVRDLASAYPVRPLPELLSYIVATQEILFGLLEKPQRPSQGRQLYFLSGVVGGLLAKASHDLGDPSAALTQSRTAYLCAEQADHNGLRAWVLGLQSLISYWAGRPHEAIRYAQRGTEYARLAGSTAAVWLPSNEARAWAKLNNVEEARSAIERAENAWALVRRDDLDEMGGLATFSRTRQLYYAADSLAWLTTESAGAEDYATQAVEAYADPANEDYAFGDQAGSYADLAIARIARAELEGATEAIAPVLALEPEKRNAGIIQSAQHVHSALVASPRLASSSRALQEQIEEFAHVTVRALPK
jgi:tetratricopeptide (TPR) repeat protein